MSPKEEELGRCIGRGYDNDGCGYIGGESGDVCSDCNGMILSDRDIISANKLAEELMRQEREDKSK